ncbi:MAG: clumping factor A, partial [Actinomycetota bacterium]|nr:clumping factor A [Actinomycetota bacterium]
EAPKPEAEKKPEADEKPEAPEVPEVEILAPVAPVVVSAPAVKPAALAVTGVSVAVQVLFGLLLLALGALLRRRAHTA